MNINCDINNNGVYSSADDYKDWDLSKQEGVEGCVMFAVTHSPPLPLLDHMLLRMCNYSYLCPGASIGFIPYNGLPEAADVLNIN